MIPPARGECCGDSGEHGEECAEEQWSAASECVRQWADDELPNGEADEVGGHGQLHPTAYALDQHLAIAAAWSGAIDHGIDKLTPHQQQALADARQAFIALDAALRDR
ncbi:hypothetical protein Jden_0224 [Jonesia denitrificans DSM 20603]|uniref:Uncharacterized protein n=1 Tax=Jonesia denitrificans (strain ATCC 14870 / DSM 20603 / BCRC 15368 / CIP 55.134 / JCM 11481 / NBRC 15587 / NCTC 10816 / Prevot 55134) TaxID=471856 RepID=C7QYQ1_JONDD|nr:hypothetical protein Jden_0224 [Jonesia denitrificans DSM 20603]SQH19871.1 Uncharacterised protein [Jonesia denitrificans]